MDLALARRLSRPNSTRVVFCILDGLGGMAQAETMRSELEQANLANLDALASQSASGVTQAFPGSPTITPTAEEAYLALLGYDPLRYAVAGEAVSALPPFPETWGLRAMAFARDPAFARVARLAGFEVRRPRTSEAALAAIQANWGAADLFVFQHPGMMPAALRRDFNGACRALEEFDRAIPRLRALRPDVLMVAGARSTPCHLGGASWHPAPFLLHSARTRHGGPSQFTEQAVLEGPLGAFPATDVVPLAMAHARRFGYQEAS